MDKVGWFILAMAAIGTAVTIVAIHEQSKVVRWKA